jgi:hypothetical protein
MDPVIVATAEEGRRIVLSELPAEDEKDLRSYPEILALEARIDPWPVVLDSRGVIRWKEDTMISNLTNVAYGDDSPYLTGHAAQEQHKRRPVDLGMLKIAFDKGRYSRLDYLRFHKRLGYSLQGYYEILSDETWYKEWASQFGVTFDDEDEDEEASRKRPRDSDEEEEDEPPRKSPKTNDSEGNNV